jgi:hypothetical protein
MKTEITKEKAIKLVDKNLKLVEELRERAKRETIEQRIKNRDWFRKWFPLCRLWMPPLDEKEAEKPEYGPYGYNFWADEAYMCEQVCNNLVEVTDSNVIFLNAKEADHLIEL